MARTAKDQHSHRQFRAFVSYSHADKADAQRLHRKLETYRLPKHLRDAGEGGKRAGRIGPIFRDREDLPAAEDLTESVQQALAQSGALVVLCSPNAQKSPWVAREIELFRQLHPDRPVLAALLEAEPDDAFPAPLREGREPLAADLRAEGDGPRLGFLKIVAGVAGVPLDALVNRDAQRRVKRVTAITVASLAAMVVMALMTTFAIQQRNEAQAQREAAEGLIEFMLTDLRTELKGVGRLDVMDNVNARSLQYFTEQGQISDLPSTSLLGWAQNLQAIGEDETKKVDPDLDRALAMFEAAHEATEELYQREPEDPDRLFAHAQSLYWVGWIAELGEDYTTAHAKYADYRDFSKKLAALEPGTKRSVTELGYGELNMGIMSFKQDDLDRSEGEFSRAIEHFAASLALDPTSRDAMAALANAYAWRFNVYFQEGEFSKALAEQQRAAELKRAVLKVDPDSLEARFSLLIAQRAIAVTRMELGEGSHNKKDLIEISRQVDLLLQADKNNNEWLEFRKKIKSDIRR